MKYFFSSLLLLSLAISNVTAQHAPLQIIPPSPNAASLGKYGEVPVNLYTGQSNVNIPIYELVVGDIKYPISLSYATGGIKVEEIASWVGLGWSISGGVITRTVKGLPDDGPYGICNTPFPVTAPPHEMTYQEFQRYAFYGLGDYDSQHDFFYFNMNGEAGKFVLDAGNNNEVVLLPKQKILVKHTPDFQTWTIISADGYKYTFDKKETMSNYTSCSNGTYSSQEQYISSWYLGKIESPKSNNYILFEYTPQSLSYETMHSETLYKRITGAFKNADTKCGNYINNSTTLRLTRILGSNGVAIEFNANIERCDLDGDNMLSEIVIKDSENVPLKKINFSYKYLSGNELREISLFNPLTNNNNPELRLVLTDIIEQGYHKENASYSNITRNIGHFEYNYNIGLPSRLSNSQDLWGFYNGQLNSSTIVPAMYWGSEFLPGANRQPNLNYSLQGSLKKMHYPTGGETWFNYELNSCRNYGFVTETSEKHTFRVGKTFQSIDTLVLNQPRSVSLEMGISEYDNCNEQGGCKIQLYLRGENGISQFESNSYPTQTLVTQQLSLPAGTYYLGVIINDPTYASQLDSYYLFVEWAEIGGIPYHDVGGLRIKSISDYDPVSGDTLTKRYIYTEENSELTSGYLNSHPKHNYLANFRRDCTYGYNYTNLVRTSNSNIPLSNTNKGIVGYGRVTEYIANGIDTLGFIVQNYFSPNDHPDWLIVPQHDWHGGTGAQIELGSIQAHTEGQLENPFPPLDDKDWKRGLLKSKLYFNSLGTKIKSQYWIYKFYDEIGSEDYDVTEVLGVKVSPSGITMCGQPDGFLTINFYKLRSSRYELIEELDSLFDKNENFLIASEKQYEYNNPTHLQLTKTISNNSDGKEQITEFKYSDDLRAIAPAEMWDETNPNYKHMHSQIIESSVTINGQTISKERTRFRLENNKILLDAYLTSPTGGTLETRIKFIKYDLNGNILETNSMADEDNIRLKTSYVWGYNNTLPIAKIEGLSYSQVETALGEPLILMGSGGQTLSPNQIQILRNNFPGAKIITYTYDELKGVKTQEDANGLITSYEYDDLGRLKLVKDNNGNTLKSFTYHYKQ